MTATSKSAALCAPGTLRAVVVPPDSIASLPQLQVGRRLIAVVLAVLFSCSVWLIWWRVAGAGHAPTSCTLERIVVNGNAYGRSTADGCKFVDDNGHVLAGR